MEDVKERTYLQWFRMGGISVSILVLMEEWKSNVEFSILNVELFPSINLQMKNK